MSLGENSDEIMNLFVSFDIVNSTQYKSQDKDGWATSVSKIMRRIISQFSNNPTGGYDFWKTLGDEIIYTKKIGTVTDLLDTLDEIYSSLVFLNKKIRRGELSQGISSEILSIKAATWIADLSSSHEKTGNILTYYQINDKRRQADYIGPDIDAGFRASHYSMSNRMVISFEIACLLMRYEKTIKDHETLKIFPMKDRIHILSYKELKGVWEQTPYPILLYHGDPSIKFDDSITELEKQKFPLINEYLDRCSGREKALLPNYTCYQEQELIEHCQKLNLTEKIDRIHNLMEKTGSVSTQDVKDLKLVHYCAVCYFQKGEDIEFLIMKNKDTGEWGFGQADFFYNAQFVEQTEKGYLDNYGVSISVENDNNYHVRIPLVVSYTGFSKELDKYISRTVFLGRLNEMPIINENNKDKLFIVSEKDIECFDGKTGLLFKETLFKCAEKIRMLKWDKQAKRII